MCERGLSGKAGGGERTWGEKGGSQARVRLRAKSQPAGCWAASGHTTGQEVGGLLGYVLGRHPLDQLPTSTLSYDH